jgi:hypothetical protein
MQTSQQATILARSTSLLASDERENETLEAIGRRVLKMYAQSDIDLSQPTMKVDRAMGSDPGAPAYTTQFGELEAAALMNLNH